MTRQLLERTVREWVDADPRRGARTLDRLAGRTIFQAADRSTEEIIEALVRLVGRFPRPAPGSRGSVADLVLSDRPSRPLLGAADAFGGARQSGLTDPL